jgi:hypothetical protein
MADSRVSAVSVAKNDCMPFILEVMVSSPEAGYKFELLVERQCASASESIWKLVFDLYKKFDDEFVKIVHVSFTAGSQDEAKGVSSMATDGVTFDAAKKIRREVHPAAKDIEGNPNPTDEQKERLNKAMSDAAKAQLDSIGS